jgi:predicted nucleic acid-binding protein
MILVDTSVWVDHLRRGDKTLTRLLTQGQVCIHPMIIGELACGHLQNRKQLIDLWQNLPCSVEASHPEVMLFVESHRLMGQGIGFVDAHLLTSTRLTANARLWTRDKRLVSVAQSLGVEFSDG